jgi:FkbM family methyltransferase
MTSNTAPSQNVLWELSKRFAVVRGWIKDRTGGDMTGLGFLLRKLKTDREFEANGFRWFFDHRIAGTYMRLVAGRFNEPETQAFLQYVAGSFPEQFTFVDVGANIGEMVVAMTAHPKVTRTYAFEPHPVCFEVCRKNLEINGLGARAEVRNTLVGDGTPQPYVVDQKYAPTSGIRPDLPDAPRTTARKIDDELTFAGPCLMLIDVESAELDVMKGARAFIQRSRPLIIFEYHWITRERFSLDEVRAELGGDYQLYRLRSDGHLDTDLGKTYNVVAVHRSSPFAPICAARQRQQ